MYVCQVIALYALNLHSIYVNYILKPEGKNSMYNRIKKLNTEE